MRIADEEQKEHEQKRYSCHVHNLPTSFIVNSKPMTPLFIMFSIFISSSHAPDFVKSTFEQPGWAEYDTAVSLKMSFEHG